MFALYSARNRAEKTIAALPIEGKELTTWNVLPGGARIALHFIGIDVRRTVSFCPSMRCRD